ncbi:response regulator transcription factor [Nocardioides sp. AE5]|uniref:response regulator transcription factor n=1 Tax=Nocardioides sp. AE5 TaxID=2962573 RepID=UPI002882667E|nr:response regulator transcription factor [Nocardioides sp. AE5]MDT0203840.1 response regulator transcription factor [Nocardioides sp. AE5]
MIRVVLADDQALIRAGLAAIIGAEPDMEVVGEASDGAEAVQVAVTERADVVLMDVEMPGTDGLAGVRALIPALPAVKVLMLTMFDVEGYVFESLKAGASGFLLKTTPPTDLVEAIRSAYAGRQVLAPSVVGRLVDHFVRRPAGRHAVPAALSQITEREMDVLKAIARGMSNAEIAAHLHLSEATVKTYVTRILAKLRLRDRVQLVILAYESGLVDG